MTRLFDSLSGTINNKNMLVTNEDVIIINSLENPPPVPVSKEDVYVRKCRLAGDGINCHFGCFHTEDLPGLLEKVQGVSCLIGHRKDTLGIARFFGGSVECHNARDRETGGQTDMRFIVPKIYWMKKHTLAEDIRINIDGGIYHQASISWYFDRPVCGICGKDIRTCDHVPGKKYDGKLCFFWYEGIGEVLEGSIVYAGGHPGTGFELNEVTGFDMSNQQELYKAGGSSIQKEDILPYLQNIDSGTLYLVGDLAKTGRTSGPIDVLPDNDAVEYVGDLLPPYLAGRIVLHRSFDAPGSCIKVNSESVLEIEKIPHPDELSTCPGRDLPEKEDGKHQKELAAAIKSMYYAEDYMEKVYSPADLPGDLGPSVVMPYYDGIPALVECDDEKGSGGEKVRLVSIHVMYESVLAGFLESLRNEIQQWDTGNFQIAGELVAYRGRSRYDIEPALYRGEPLPGNLKFILKATDFVENSAKKRPPLHRRLERLSLSALGSKRVQCIPHKLIVNHTEIPDAARSFATRGGIFIVPDDSDFRFDSQRRILAYENYIDVSILTVKVTQGGYVYRAGIMKNGSLIPLGATHITSEEFSAGDIIRVAVDSVFLSDDSWKWRNPRVLGRRNRRSKPDSIAVIERLARRLNGTAFLSGTGISSIDTDSGNKVSRIAAKRDFTFESCGEDDGSLAVLKVVVNGATEVFCMNKEDIESLNEGYWCPGTRGISRAESEEAFHNLGDKTVLLDSGECTMFESGQYQKKCAFAGNVLHGIYMFRRISVSGRDRWYIRKM